MFKFDYIINFICNFDKKIIHENIDKNECLICKKYGKNICKKELIQFYGNKHKYIKDNDIYECYNNNIKIRADMKKFLETFKLF